ncbi:Hypothetical_protein [Hexamita inflata]|uniref:Hypothetical_protein n=1 Tax=Hexamita inflata TaxID=28002 RepID=A0AA86PBI0_9EUKA|nr:Hypothetical protein HINF_LOCUS23143 [Hexamita inflata]
MFPQIYLLHYPSPPLYTTKSNHISIYILLDSEEPGDSRSAPISIQQTILNTILNITLIQSYLVSQLISFHHTTTLHKPPPSSLRSSVRRQLQRSSSQVFFQGNCEVLGERAARTRRRRMRRRSQEPSTE